MTSARKLALFIFLGHALTACTYASSYLQSGIRITRSAFTSGSTAVNLTFGDWLGGYGVYSDGFVTGQLLVAGAGDGGMKMPSGVAVDTVHHLAYVADVLNNRISKYNLTTGAYVGSIGNLLSSSGTCASSGAATGWCTGGIFTTGSGDGMFNVNSRVAVDSTNQLLYVSDQANHRVVKINASTGAFIGAIGNLSATTGTCPASGAASAWCTGGTFTSGSDDGMFNSPSGIGLDVSGNRMYVADYNNSRIEQFNLTTGAFIGAIGKTSASSGTCPASGVAPGWCTGGTFVGGNGDGVFSQPMAIAVDAGNNALYVTDQGPQMTVKLNLTTGAFIGAIGFLVGSTGTCPGAGFATGWCTGGTFQYTYPDSFSTSGFSNVPGIAVDAANDALYIATGNPSIDKFTLSTGALVGAIGYLSSSTGTCPSSGPAGTWCTDGVFTSAEDDNAFSNLADIGLDGAGNLIFVDTSRLGRLSLTTTSVTGNLGSLSHTSSGWALASTSANSVRGTIDSVFNGPSDMAVDSAHGYVYVADRSNYRIEKFRLATGAFVGAIGKLSASSGTCPSSGVATRWCTGGTFTAGTTDGAFEGLWGIGISSNYLYVADATRIQKFSLSTGAFVGAIGGGLTASTGTCASSGVASGWCTGGSFASGGSPAGTLDGMLSGGQTALHVDDTNGYLYVADTYVNKISKFNLATGAFVGGLGATSASSGTCPNGGIATTWCTGGEFASLNGDGGFSSPLGLEVDAARGLLYVADSGNNRIVKIDLGTGAFMGAIGGVSASGGTCPGSGAVGAWCTGGTFQSDSIDGAFSWPNGLAFDGDERILYISDSGNYRLAKINATTGAFVGAMGLLSASSGSCPSSGAASTWCTGGTFTYGSNSGEFYSLTSLAFDSLNSILFAVDSDNHRVSVGLP